MEINKLNKDELEVTKTESKTTKYNRVFLLERQARIIADMENYAKVKQAQLDEIEALLSQFDESVPVGRATLEIPSLEAKP